MLPQDVEIVDASKFLDGLSLNFSARITKAMKYLRIFADLVPQLESYKRVAYFDCDVLFNRDPGELLSSAMHAPLQASHDLPS